MYPVLRTGFGSSGGSVTSLSFQPDLIWEKTRNLTGDHFLVDSVRTASKTLSANTTAAEATNATYFTSFNSNGYSLGSGDWSNSYTLVDWCWKAGTTSASNTNGSITSTVSAGATQGFSVVTYTGNGSSSATVGHGLGVAPSMIIVKARSGGSDWETFHTSLGSSFGIRLNTTAAKVAASSTAGGIISTSPTSTTFGFTAGTSNVNNANESGITFVAYCFAAVAGYSAFGSYTGNGSADGPFVYTGFRPRFILVKSSTAAQSWQMYDSTRNPSNEVNCTLFANGTNAESTSNGNFDFLSNGFKLRNGDFAINKNAESYIYMAFAENPFKNSHAR
jgi:hypothetical protein